MRKFSIAEQHVSSLIVNSEIIKEEGMVLLDAFLENNYFNLNTNKSILVDPSLEKAYLSIGSNDKDICRNEIVEVTRLINLLIELEKSALITFIGEENLRKTAIGFQKQNGTTVELVHPLSSFLYKKIGNYILPSEELFELVRNNFKTEEYLRHKETIKLTKIALATSILIGLSSVIIGMISIGIGVLN